MSTKLPVPIFLAKVASLYAAGMGLQKIAAEIKAETGDSVTHRDVKRAIESDECKALIEEIAGSMIAQAKTQLRGSVARLVPKIISTIETNLDKHNPNILPYALKIIGFEGTEDKKVDTTLNIILPDAKPREVNINEVQRSADSGSIQYATISKPETEEGSGGH